MANMTSQIRHQVCKTRMAQDNSFSKTRRMINKETKLKLKCFYIYIEYDKLLVKLVNCFSLIIQTNATRKKCKMALYVWVVSAFI